MLSLMYYTAVAETPVQIGNWDQHIASVSASSTATTSTATTVTTSVAQPVTTSVIGDMGSSKGKPADKSNEQHDSGE